MRNNEISYSVVLPTSGGRCLCGALNSIIAQTFPPAGVHITNDMESLLECCEKLIKNSDIVRLHSGLQFHNVSLSRNYAASHATSRWIAFLDDDDSWMLDKMQVQQELLLRGNVKFIGSNALRVSSNTPYFKDNSDKEIRFRDLLNENAFITSSVVIDRKLFLRVGGFPKFEGPGEDYLLWLKVLLLEGKGFVSGNSLVRYCDLGQSISRKDIESGGEQRKRILKGYVNLEPGNTLNIQQILRNWYWNSYIEREILGK